MNKLIIILLVSRYSSKFVSKLLQNWFDDMDIVIFFKQFEIMKIVGCDGRFNVTSEQIGSLVRYGTLSSVEFFIRTKERTGRGWFILL